MTDMAGVECVDLARWLTFETGKAWECLWRYGIKGDRWEQLGNARRNIESALDGPTRPIRDHDDIPKDVWIKFRIWDNANDGNVADAMRCIWHAQFVEAWAGALQVALCHIDTEFARLRVPTMAEFKAKYTHLLGEFTMVEQERDQLLYERDSA